MNSKELLRQLQEKMSNYNLEALKKEYATYCSKDLAADDVNGLNHRFNLETLISLLENPGDFFGEPLNQRYLEKFRDTINLYMDTHAPEDPEFKDYIRRLNCYRTFVLKIPMHPVGMSFEQGRVIQKGQNYYCTAKKFYMNQKDSLCRFCVAKLSEL